MSSIFFYGYEYFVPRGLTRAQIHAKVREWIADICLREGLPPHSNDYVATLVADSIR